MSWTSSQSTGTALLWSRPRSLSQLAGGGGGPCTSEEVESEFSIPKLFLHGGLLLMLRESLLQTVRRKEERTESGVEPDVATAMARESASHQRLQRDKWVRSSLP